jgi:putative ABC transport system substrate-binding protein
MKRREFITLIGGAVALPLTAHAQQPMPVIGWLSLASEAPFAHFADAFRRGLADSGFVEGRNVAIEYRWAEGQAQRLPEFAADLVRRKVTLIMASAGVGPPLAAKAATTTIPIVFVAGTTVSGLVPNLNRPAGNITGVHWFTTTLEGKRFGLARDLVPGAAVIGALVNPNRPAVSQHQASQIETAAQAVGQRVLLLRAQNEAEFGAAFETFEREKVGAVAVAADPTFNSLRDRLTALALQHRLPAIFETREYAAAGGLMSYGPNLAAMYRLAGGYAGRIVKGEKPGDLPVMQPTTFEFVINLKTAKALGLTIPSGLLASADEVIE